MIAQQEREKSSEEEIQFLKSSLSWRYAIRDGIITAAASIAAASVLVTLSKDINLVNAGTAGILANTLFNLYRADGRRKKISELNHSLMFQTVTDPDSGMSVELPRDYNPEDAKVSARSVIRAFETGKTSLVMRNTKTGKLEPVETVDS